MQKYRLAIINTNPMDFAYGGVAPIMRNMHQRLTRYFDITYYCLPDKWKSRRLLPGRAKMLLYIKSMRKELCGYDFILSHIPEGSYAIAQCGVPFAHVYHGNTNPMEGSRYWFGKYFKKIFERFFKVIQARASLRYTVGTPWDDVKKLVNPIRHNIAPQPLAARKGFIYAGRLEGGKNIDRIITVYSKLTEDERLENPLTIAGTGTLADMLRAKASETGVDKEVTFTGMLSNPELVELDSRQKILLMASDFEGFPTAIAEALTLGVPVITTDVGDIPRFIKDGVNGHLLKPGFSDDEYIAAIRDVLAHYGHYASEAFETGRLFDADKITDEVADDIINIIKARRK